MKKPIKNINLVQYTKQKRLSTENAITLIIGLKINEIIDRFNELYENKNK